MAAGSAVAAFEEDDARRARVDVLVVARDRLAGDLLDRAGELDAGRSAADDAEGQHGAPRLGAAFVLGRLERQQDPPPQLGRILERLQSGRDRGPLVVAEVRVRRACREHQVVVGEPSRRLEQQPSLTTSTPVTGEGDLAVVLAANDRADRRADVGRRERCGRHLVEQRLKDMMVAPIEDGHGDRRLRQRFRGGEARKAAADDQDAVGAIRPSKSYSQLSRHGSC